ncbi:hypothetical protein BG004_001023 [Podila humilis]|nr:hypothetical protein BG004_001023 [Podila humilis]
MAVAMADFWRYQPVACVENAQNIVGDAMILRFRQLIGFLWSASVLHDEYLDLLKAMLKIDGSNRPRDCDDRQGQDNGKDTINEYGTLGEIGLFCTP